MGSSNVGDELNAKRALVTAGASGIGRAIADALIAAGAHVHICDLSSALLEEFRKRHPSAFGTVADEY